MVPLIELRGAIPYAVGFIESGVPLNLALCYAIAIVGNMLPVPFIFFFARKVLEWGKDKKIIGKFFTFCLEKGHKGGEKLQAKAGRGLYFALFLYYNRKTGLVHVILKIYIYTYIIIKIINFI